MLLTIDPSVAAARTGWAVWEGQTLRAAGKGEPPRHYPLTHVHVEKPRIYPGGRTPNPNDILELGFAAGTLAGRYEGAGCAVRTLAPRDWKGTLDKDAMCRRVWSRLSPFEQEIAKAFRPEPSGKVLGGKDHVLDAIGIGLHVLGRLRSG